MCEDVKKNWLNVARKCQSVCGQERGFSVVQIVILVGPGGEPVFWLQPEMSKIEPLNGASGFLTQVMEKVRDGKLTDG